MESRLQPTPGNAAHMELGSWRPGVNLGFISCVILSRGVRFPSCVGVLGYLGQRDGGNNETTQGDGKQELFGEWSLL